MQHVEGFSHVDPQSVSQTAVHLSPVPAAWWLAERCTSQLTQHLLDEVELINVTVAREERLGINELGHDAPTEGKDRC
jgi:hypothetical protein